MCSKRDTESHGNCEIWRSWHTTTEENQQRVERLLAIESRLETKAAALGVWRCGLAGLAGNT